MWTCGPVVDAASLSKRYYRKFESCHVRHFTMLTAIIYWLFSAISEKQANSIVSLLDASSKWHVKLWVAGWIPVGCF